MSSRSKGARLYLRPARLIKGKPAPARWVIRDGGAEIGLGCSPGDREEAERKLAEYIASKYAPERRERPLAQIPVSDVISFYLMEVVYTQRRPEKAAGRAQRLIEFWGNKTLADVTGSECRAYAEWREGKGKSRKGTGGGARRDLQDLAAAINLHHKDGRHRETVRVTLPQRGESRKRWLSREEVRQLWRACQSYDIWGGKETTRQSLKHIGRFVLFGAFTGSRPGALLSARWDDRIGSGWVDLTTGMFYRHADGERATAKRQPPVPLYPPLWRLMRRWAQADGHAGPVVAWEGQAIASVKTAMGRAVELAGLGKGVTGYTLRHTAASWLIQNGVSTRKVAEILGTSEAMVERHYDHLHPDHLRGEVTMFKKAGGKAGGKVKMKKAA